MSDYANNLLKAIESGEQESMSSAFNTAVNAKVMDALDAKRIEVAQSIYGGQQSSDEEQSISDEEVVATETSEEDGTEEV